MMTTKPFRLLLTFMPVLMTVPVMGQIPVELTIEGLASVLESSETDYTATARFDNGQSFEVTLQCDWSVAPSDYASINSFGRLTTLAATNDEEIVVEAQYTLNEVTVENAFNVTIINVPKDEGADPWPFWGRTTTRLGRTSTRGPATPRIDWSVVISSFPFENILEASPVMDAFGRIMVGTVDGMTGVNSVSRDVLWMETDGDTSRGVALWQGRVVWGDVAPFSTLYCHDAATGEELWTFPAPIGFNQQAPVVDQNGVVYIHTGLATMYARRMEDGSEVWSEEFGTLSWDAPSLDWPLLLSAAGGANGLDLVGLDPLDGSEILSFHTSNSIFGASVILEGRVYVASNDRFLYAIDAETGEEIWNFWCEQLNRGSIAIGHDGTIYTATTGNVGILFAITPEGDEIWRLELPGLVSNAPIVAGDGLIYICSSHWTGSDYESRVHAVRPDGTELWAKLMPDDVRASPMLAPDGTLYVVCRDKRLYAFRDPAGDLDHDGDVDIADFAHFESCRTEPRIWGEQAKTAPGCELLDFDRDWDVDLADFAQLQQAYTAPPNLHPHP